MTTLTVAIVGGGDRARAAERADASGQALKAAFLFNFAKFAEWPALSAAAPILVCIVGDEAIASAFSGTVRGQHISGHALEVSQPQDSAGWRACHVLFVAERETGQFAGAKGTLKSLPILTVGDGKTFSQTGGMIEIFIEDGRMRFVINRDVAEQAGIHLSSRLLGLAKIIRNEHGQ